MASIKDVAAAAGVSPTTVSSVINGLNCVKPSTREKVLAAIERLGYAPDIAARELVTGKKQNIGLVLMTYAQYASRKHTLEGGEEVMYEDYINGIAQQISGSNYGLLIEYFNYVPGSSELPQIIRQKRVAGVIVAGSIYADEFIDLLKQEIGAVVTIGCQSTRADYVANDYQESVRTAVGYLIAQGHRNIAYLSGDAVTYAYPHKLKGYCQGLEEAGIPFRAEMVIPCRYLVAEGYRAVETVCRMPTQGHPTAILCAGDLLAVGAYRYFYEKNIRVPQDYSLMGYENTNLSVYMNPRLTTMEWHKSTMTQQACQLLLDRLRHPASKNTGVIVPCDIVVRESVCPPGM